jgi:hypothetical protein
MKHEPREHQGQRHPDAAPDPRFPVPDGVSFTVEEPEVQAQHRDDKDTESQPQPR